MEYEKLKKEIEELKGTPYEYLKKCVEKGLEIHEHMRERKIDSTNDKINLEKLSNMKIPKDGRNMLEVIKEIRNDVCVNALYLQHPRFFAYACNAVTPYALIGQVMQSIYNMNGVVNSFQLEAAVIEKNLINWMASLAGYDTEKCFGNFTSGGSMSNTTGIAAGRDAILKPDEWGKGVVYTTRQSHSSNIKAVHLIGFRDDQIVYIPYDEEFKMIPEELEKAIKIDLEKGRKPAIVIANLASTNTGEIDPLDKIGDITKKYKMWLHVDGAYGGSILISDKYRHLAKGIEKSDSFSWDMHKWLMQCYSCSVVIVKNKEDLFRCFTSHHEYLDDAQRPDLLDSMDMGPEMSKPLRFLEFWISLQIMGTNEFEKFVNNSIEYAEYTYEVISKWEDVEIVSKPSCGTLNFRFVKDNMSLEKLNKMNAEISKEIVNEGVAYIITTILNEKKVLRKIYMNGLTTVDDINMTLESVRRCADKIIKGDK